MGSFCHPPFILLTAMLATVRDRRLQGRGSKMSILWKQDWVRSPFKTIGIVAFGGYVLWNAAWLLYGHIPPSILVYCIGLPAPTTGMTRSLLSFFEGNWKDFLLFNPLTSIYIALMGISIAILVKQRIQRLPLVLPVFLAWSWLVAIVLGWLLKFAIGNKYW